MKLTKLSEKKINLENRFAKKTIRQETIEAETKTVTTVSRKTKNIGPEKKVPFVFEDDLFLDVSVGDGAIRWRSVGRRLSRGFQGIKNL